MPEGSPPAAGSLQAEAVKLGAMDRRPWLQFDWSRHTRSLDLGRARVNAVFVDGEPGAVPLLFIHGLGGCWRNWLEQLPILGPRYGAVAFDLPGFGDSPLLAGETSITAFVDVTRRLLEYLELDRVHLVGNSMGGLIACEIALAEPERVKAVTLISPAGYPFGEHRLRFLQLLYPVMDAGGRYIASHAEAVARRPRLRNVLLQAVAAHPERFDPLLAAEQFKGMGKPGLMPALQSLLSHTLAGKLHGVKAPVLLIWGELDPVLPVEMAERFVAELPDVRKVILPDVGHVAMLEVPTVVNELIVEHATKLAGTQAEPAS